MGANCVQLSRAASRVVEWNLWFRRRFGIHFGFNALELRLHFTFGSAGPRAQYYRDHNFRPLDEKGETFYMSMKEMRDTL
jgi:hypothetical protein